MSWPKIRLGDVIRHRKNFITIDDLKIYKRVRVQLHAQGIVVRDVVPGAMIKTKRQQACRAGEFLVAEIDAKVGGFGIVPESLDGGIVSSHYFLYEINESKLDRRFLDFFIRTRTFRDQVEAQGSTNYAAIRPADVLGYQIPLPPLAEQRRVVTRIERLLEEINKAKYLRMQTTQDLYVLFTKQVLSVFAPFSTQLQEIGKVFRVTTGGTPSRTNPAYWAGDVKWVSSGEVAFCRISETRETISRLGVESSNAKIYSPSTVLIAMIGQGKTRGQCAILDCFAATNQNVAGIHVSETKHSPEYVYWWLYANYQKSRFEEMGTAQPALSGARVKQMQIPLPSLSQQLRVVSDLACFEERVRSAKRLQAESAAELDSLLPSILDRAFSQQL